MKQEIDKDKFNLEVSFSTAIYPFHQVDGYITVVVDIFRATTAICTAFMNGVHSLIPVATVEEAKELKEKGYMVASERDGVTLDFADFGNSPFNFTRQKVEGKTIAYSTTNGTKAIQMAKNSDQVLIGSFLNLQALADYCAKQRKPVHIMCSGWKKRFSMEDTLFAGALVDKLLETEVFDTICDSAIAALELWKLAAPNPLLYVEKAAHRHRLKKLGLDDILEYSLTPNQTQIIPVLKQDRLVVLE